MSVNTEVNSVGNSIKEVHKDLTKVEADKIVKSTANLSADERWPFLTSKPSEIDIQEVEKNFLIYDIDSFRRLRFNSPPENKYVRTAGYVHIEEDMVYLRSSRENLRCGNINITFGHSVDYPEPGILIEVFGKIYFEKTEKKAVPFVQVYFFRKLKGSYLEYVELYKMLQSI